MAEGIISGEAGLAKGGLLTLGAEALEKILHAHIGARNFRGIRTFAMANWPADPDVPDTDPLDDPVFVEVRFST